MPSRLFLILCFFSLSVYAQDTDNASYYGKRVPISSIATEIKVNSDGRVSIGYGNLRYYTFNPKKGWHYLSGNRSPGFFDDSWKEVHWITDNIGLTLEYEGPSPYPEPVIYRTTDKGIAYYQVYRLERRTPHFSICIVGKSGRIWLTGKTGLMISSTDLGKTWETYRLPDNIEPSSVSFYDDVHGMMTTNTQQLYQTSNSGKTWKSLSAPFPELALDDRGKERALKISLTDKYYIVLSNKKLFYRLREKESWDSMDCVYNFDFDPVSKNIYIVSCNKTIACFTNGFIKQWENPEKLSTVPREIKGRNDTLYFFDWSEGQFGFVNPIEIFSGTMYSLDDQVEEPFYKVTIGGKKWGMEENEVFGYNETSRKWFRLAVLPFSCWNISVYKDSAIFITDVSKANQYIFNVYTNQYKLYKVDQPVNNFLRKPIKSFTVSKSEQGCFHGGIKSTDYIKSEDGYFETNETTQTSGPFLTYRIPDITIAYQNKMPVAEVDSFLGQLNKKFWSTPELEDFEINDSAIMIFNRTLDEIRENIRSNKEGGRDIEMEGIRFFTFFNNKLMDSSLFNTERILSEINNVSINKCFQTPDASSTTWCNYVLTFTNEENEKLTISHSESDKYFFGESWYNPWTITIDDHFFTTRNLSITKFFLKNAPPGFMLQKNALNALFLFKIGYLLSRNEIPTD